MSVSGRRCPIRTFSIHWLRSENKSGRRGARDFRVLAAGRFCVKRFKAEANKRAEPFGIDHTNTDFGGVTFCKLLNLAGNRCRDVPSCHDSDGGSASPLLRVRMRLQDRLRKEWDQPIASSFRGNLELYKILCAVPFEYKVRAIVHG